MSSSNTYRSLKENLLAKQYEAVLEESWSQFVDEQHTPRIWRQEPVDILTFCREFLDRRNLSEFHLDALEAFAGNDLATWDDRFQVYAFVFGQGGGKNFLTEILCSYTMYKLLCMTNPHKFFGLDEGFLDILNISFTGTERQAKEIFFENIKNTIRSTTNPETGRNWFEEHGVDLRDYGIGDIKEHIIKLPRRIRARCLPFTQAAFEGANILLGVIDEPSRAVVSPPANKRAHTVFARMRSNSRTRFKQLGKVVAFSYPEAEDDDLIMELWEQAGTRFSTSGRQVRSGPEIMDGTYASMGTSFEVNPRLNESDFEEEAKADPEGVQTRIYVNPPHSKTGFYRTYPHKIKESFCLSEEKYAVIKYEVLPITHNFQQNGRLVSRTFTGVKLLWARGDVEWRAIGGDPGEKNDIFTLALARTVPTKKPIRVAVVNRERFQVEPPPGLPSSMAQEYEHYVRRSLEIEAVDQLVVIDGLVEIKPIRYRRHDPNKGREVWDTYPISFNSVRDFIIELKQHFPNLDEAGFDRWNSSSLIEDLLHTGERCIDGVLTEQGRWCSER